MPRLQLTQQFLSDLLAAGYKPGSASRLMALVKYIFSMAEKWEVIDKSPARGISKVADNSSKERFLTGEETERLLAALKQSKSPVLRDMIEFLILTGARKSEAINARWEAVIFFRVFLNSEMSLLWMVGLRSRFWIILLFSACFCLLFCSQ
jgi:site-specific recombinase XerD